VIFYLVDTDVISAGAPARRERSRSLVLWMDQNSERLFISTITVAEIADGIAKAHREGSGQKALALAGWLDTIVHLYSERILPFDIAAARIAGTLSDRARGIGSSPGFADLAIAAIAAAHELTVLTANLRRFGPLGIPTHNPLESVPRG
jgi:predicted nucleic acid-binding protein